MIRPKLTALVVCMVVARPFGGHAAPVAGVEGVTGALSELAVSWPVAASLRATVGGWARRQGWPAPQFLTTADWPVDVPGSIPGSIEQALEVLADGFGHAAARPRIQLFANHVIVVSEFGDDR